MTSHMSVWLLDVCLNHEDSHLKLSTEPLTKLSILEDGYFISI